MRALFFFFGTPLLLGSWWGLAFALTALLCGRISHEEEMLQSGLEGYEDHRVRVRFRPIPLIW